MPIDFIEQLAFSSSVPLISAFFIGIATAIAPCAFAANAAAISYMAHKMDSPGKALRAGILFTIGRMSAYVAIGAAMIIAGRVIGEFARGTQSYGNLIIGPVLIIMGLAFCGTISIGFSSGGGIISSLASRFSNRGEVGAFAMGIIFAFAFCPYSGMLFFGMLIPMALGSSYGVVLPAVFGVGVSVPVVAFVVLMHISTSRAKGFGIALNSMWPYMSRAIGIILVIIGSYYLSPYLHEYYGVSYSFELLTLIFLSFVGLAFVRSKLSSIEEVPGETTTDKAVSAPPASSIKSDENGHSTNNVHQGLPRR